MSLVTVTAPTIQPVSLADAKDQCRVLDSLHDLKIQRLLTSAVAAIEILTGARLAPQTVRLDLDGFPSGKIDLCAYPISAVTSVVYDDADDVEQTLVASTDYWVSLGGMYPSIVPVSSWPTTKSGKPASVRITMTAGYASADVVPADLKHAVLVQVKEWFDITGDTVVGINVESMRTIESLVSQHRRMVV